jgi:hypothetical protein
MSQRRCSNPAAVAGDMRTARDNDETTVKLELATPLRVLRHAAAARQGLAQMATAAGQTIDPSLCGSHEHGTLWGPVRRRS